jgi:hypothetical protein
MGLVITMLLLSTTQHTRTLRLIGQSYLFRRITQHGINIHTQELTAREINPDNIDGQPTRQSLINWKC